MRKPPRSPQAGRRAVMLLLGQESPLGKVTSTPASVKWTFRGCWGAPQWPKAQGLPRIADLPPPPWPCAPGCSTLSPFLMGGMK